MTVQSNDPRPYLNPNNGERTSFPHAMSEFKPRAGGVVVSHASTVAGPLVTPAEDPERAAREIEALQPGCVATPVWGGSGEDWRSEQGKTPEQIIGEFA